MMLRKARGEAGARRASLLALLCTLLLSFLVGGCQPSAPALPRHAVRIQALMPLHPSWAQVVALDRNLAQIDGGSDAGDLTAFQVAPASLFAVDTVPPLSLAQQRETLAQEDLRRYMAQLDTSLKLREESALAQIVEPNQVSGPSAENLRLQAEIEKRAQELREEAYRQAAPLEAEIVALQYRKIVLQTQVDAATTLYPNALRNQPLFDAQTQMAQVNRQIDVKTTQVDGLEKADFLGMADFQLHPSGGPGRGPDETPQQRLAKRRAEQRAKLDKERGEALQKARSDLEALPSPLPELAGGSPPPDMRATSLSLFRPPDKPAAFARAQAQVAQIQGQERALKEAEKARLLAQIEADIEKAVMQIARVQGWTYVQEGQSKEDWTASVAKALRAQWTASPLP